MKKNITVIPGDGIGPEVISQTVKVLKAIAQRFNHEFQFDYCLMGACAIDKTGNPLPDETIESSLKSDAVLLGAIGHPKFDHDPSAKVRPEQGLLKLRKELELFANLRPVSTYKSLNHLSPLKEDRLKGVNFIMYRELTGGIYFGEKNLNEAGDEASDLCTYNKSEITRIAQLAFEAARKRKKRLTLVDKANVLETSRLWRKTVQELSLKYPEVKVDYMFVDNAAMQLILNPAQFDVILTENMFGDILSDEASVLTGSLGLLPSSSIGKKNALFEPIHGSYPQAAGLDIANPIGAILSAALMLDHFELHDEAEKIRQGVNWTLSNGFVTKDIDPMNSYSTSSIGELIREYIINDSPQTFNLNNISLGQATII
ncbi:MAG: 3-isopropylmalate dehydrogenase [Ginsengibacter sp.]